MLGLLGGANVSSSSLQAAWPHKMYAEAAVLESAQTLNMYLKV